MTHFSIWLYKNTNRSNLPSLDELNQLYLNRVAIGGFVNELNFTINYWSSTVYGFNWAWRQNFEDCGQNGSGKDGNYSVRAF
jgi:hypothetical protein